MRPNGSPEELERRRLHAVSLLDREYQPVEVARMVGADRRSVRRWNAAYRRGGLDAIKAKHAPGRPSRLNARANRKLERELLKGAKAVLCRGNKSSFAPL